MATIKVIDNYEIDIDSNKNYTAQKFIKMYINPKDETYKEIPQYRVIGYYSSVSSCLKAIYSDMCIKKAEKKDSITVKEWINICSKCEKTIESVIINEVGDII